MLKNDRRRGMATAEFLSWTLWLLGLIVVVPIALKHRLPCMTVLIALAAWKIASFLIAQVLTAVVESGGRGPGPPVGPGEGGAVPGAGSPPGPFGGETGAPRGDDGPGETDPGQKAEGSRGGSPGDAGEE